MNRLASSVLALALMSLHGGADAAEGRLRDLIPIAPRSDRVAKYVNESGAAPAAAQAKASGTAHGEKRTVSAAQQKTRRPAIVAKSERSGDFTVAEVGSLLLTDRDNDGYFSEFRIRFDVDTV